MLITFLRLVKSIYTQTAGQDLNGGEVSDSAADLHRRCPKPGLVTFLKTQYGIEDGSQYMVTRHTCITSWLLFYVTGCHVAETSLVIILTKCTKAKVIKQVFYNDSCSYYF